jgi:GNAT superfamily N-acetyltransferase
MRFADLELARRLEAAAGDAGTPAPSDAPDGKAILPIAGGVAVFAGIGSPVTQAVGLGLNGPVSEAEVDRLEDFFRSRGSAAILEMCPLADAAFVELLGKRGYRIAEFSNVTVRELNAADVFPALAAGVVVRPAEASETKLWARIVAEGFAEHFPITPELLATMEEFAGGAGTTCYLAWVDGNLAGGGIVTIRGGVAGLVGASTLPQFRRRGLQTALLAARLAHAQAAGCDIAMGISQPASASQRNLERFGFRVVYTRTKLVREWA